MILEFGQCLFCDEPVLPTERETDGTRELADGHVVHVECLMRSIVGSLGHLQGRCPCFGGTENDPPGMTRREAAQAAWDYYRRLKTRAN